MEENVIVEEVKEQEKPKSFVTVKNVLRALSLLCLIFVFCPAFLVSCGGKTMEVDVMTAVKGVEVYGEQVVDPQPVMLLTMLIPIASLVLLLIKLFPDKKTAGILTACGGVDLLLWLAFQSGVQKLADENNFTVETTGWYVLNMISLIIFLIVAVLVLINKLAMDDDLLTRFPGVVDAFTNPEGPVQQLIAKVLALPKKVLLAGVGGVAGVIVIACLVLSLGSTINLDKYVTITTNGYNGYGRAVAEIDWEAIQADYGEKLSFTKEAQKQYGESILGMTPITVLKSCVRVELVEPYNLSNGGEVQYKWTINEEALQFVDCKLKYADGTHKVSGLEEIEKFDPFIGVEVSFSGTSPNGRVNYELTGSSNGLSYQLDKTSGLKNGDVVTLTVSFGWNVTEADYASNYGKLPVTTTKEYTVSGLDEYISSFKDLPDAFIKTLKAEAEDSIYAYSAQSYGTGIKMENLTYAGYLLNARTSGSSSTNNELYIIYTAMVSSVEGDFETTKIYYPVRFTNILKANGEFSFGRNNGIYGSSYFGNSYTSTRGFNNPVNCYANIAKASDTYTVETGDGFEKYAKYEMVKAVADFTDDYKKTLSADAKATIEKYITENYAEETEVSNFVEVGYYFLFAKEQGSTLARNNTCYVVYSATVSHKENKFESRTIYFPVKYTGIVKLPGNEYIITEKNGIQGTTRLNDSWLNYYSTKGYDDGAKMFAGLVTSYRETYTYEVTGNLKQLGE